MKNLLNHIDKFEKLEDLPSRSNIPLGDGKWGRRKGHAYPYQKVYRFFEGSVGKNWDDVFSEFVHLDWLHDEEKTRENATRVVELKTFMKDGKVWFVDSNGEKPIIESSHYLSSLYVHPITKKLCINKKVKKPEKKKEEFFRVIGNYHQLVKVDGVWHEIKGEPAKSDIVVVDGLHYKKVKTLPVSRQTVPSVYPPLPQKFFGLKVVEEPPKYKKTADGEFYLIPSAPLSIHYWNKTKKIGPKDLMINLKKPQSYFDRYQDRQDYESVKIIYRHALSGKELKKYGLKNDVKPIFGKRCSVCGNEKCNNQHYYQRKYDKNGNVYYGE